ncbi:thiol reductant ABC exporter subunit CydC [Glutamicibacter sp. AOP38-B1-38]|uniref:thiol reductant ABC exporter subunit CydC n=1 Tax=Glutamicibacter sp. AOP38-B1-38 TaxID=3457680 RepID=UPI004033AF72
MSAPRFLPRDLLPRRQVALLAAFSVLKTSGLILVAYTLATWITQMSLGQPHQQLLLWLALGGAALRTVGVWGLNAGSRRMGAGAKEQMRANLIESAASRPGILADQRNDLSLAEASTLAGHGIEKLDDYFTKFIPALIGATVVPLLLGIYILRIDWLSALVLLLTIPLIPVFMALIGMHTQDTIEQSQAKLDALANQLYELAQGLPALLGLGRARHQGHAIAQVSERYRAATMQNLRTVFMSSFWLELISTLSVAVLAVLIGVRLVGGNMDLAAGLTILILAPELFIALREVGSAYHAADDGLAAYERYRKQIQGTPASSLRAPTGPMRKANVLEVRKLSLRYPGQNPIYSDFSMDLRAGDRQLLSTASGSGKTSLLKLIAEAQTSSNEFAAELVSGEIFVAGELACISQHPQFNAQTGTEQIAQDAPDAPKELTERLAAELNLRAMLPRAIAEYSPGELRRLEVLRALLRLHSVPSCRLLLADEPTAHLDEQNAAAVRRLLAELPEDCAMLVASHDPLITETGPTLSTRQPTPDHLRAVSQAPMRGGAAPQGKPEGNPRWNPRREVMGNYRAARKALCYGALSILCAVALAGLSGWLIVEASYQPAILHLTVAFVMVRTLGIGRAVFRYLEQLAIHDAVLGYAGALREKLWNAMVANPARWGMMSRSSVVLRYLLAEVDELRDALARVLFPPLQALIVWALGTVVLFQIQPEFGYAALGAGLFLAFPARWLVKLVEGRHLALALRHRLQLNQLVLSTLRNKEALRAYGSLGPVLHKLARAESRNTARARRHAYGQGTAPALAALTTVLLATALVTLSQSSASFTALAVLLALSLAEPAASALGAIQQGRALHELTDQLAGRGVGEQGTARPGATATQPGYTVHGYRLAGLELGYVPGNPVISNLDAQIRPGEWTALTGTSGSGKSTLLTALLGALPASGGRLESIDEHGNYRALEQGAMDSVAWCPQEAHLFDSTLRRNLNLAANSAAPASDEALIGILHRVGLAGWYAAQPAGLETRIGSGGHRLSGGQRCKLAVARALVGGQQVILLDEPTAHLGVDESAELIRTLRAALAGRTVVLITHEPKLAEICEGSICLDRTLAPAS